MNPQHPSLWTPSQEFVENSNLKQYETWLTDKKNLNFSSYQDLWKWSVQNTGAFWESIWDYFDVIHHTPYRTPLSSEIMPGARWFEGATLNYAEHIFRKKNDGHPALIFKSETGELRNISWRDLEKQVAAVQAFLISEGVQQGDRIAAYLPNIPEAIVSFLAVNSLGAIWACCSPDFGVHTVIDRFSQIKPKLLVTADGYTYNGKRISRESETAEIVKNIKSIQKTVLIPSEEPATKTDSLHAIHWQDVLSTPSDRLVFTPVDFNHPIWILYSSGTTGKPKPITHSHGGMLLEHLKYLHFHNDVKPGENFFWFTTTGWMMWNFLQASLLAGATPVLYDGSPGFPDLNALWELAAEIPIHHFGTSAPWLVACMKKELRPGNAFRLTELRSIGSTGAPLPPETFDWVYGSVKNDVWLCSMSGGTDVCTAFVGGCPYEPVVCGRIQCRALGCDLQVFDENGRPVTNKLGEMIVGKPMPCMPIFFWGDEGNKRYTSSYFKKFKRIWRHGDWIKLFDDGSLIIQGRSDATLNRKGVRIGTAEIYRVLGNITGIKDSLIVNLEKSEGGDVMPLFVVLEDESKLEQIAHTIKEELKSQCSPRHVPDRIIAVPDIPYTLSGKKMEVPVKRVLLKMDGRKEINKDAMRNPAAMDHFIQLAGKF